MRSRSFLKLLDEIIQSRIESFCQPQIWAVKSYKKAVIYIHYKAQNRVKLLKIIPKFIPRPAEGNWCVLYYPACRCRMSRVRFEP